jgi:hypothetical protein
MTTKQLGATYNYLVDVKYFSLAMLKRYRDTLPDTERKCKIGKSKVLAPIPGSRSCQVLGTADTLRLSSKSLVDRCSSHFNLSNTYENRGKTVSYGRKWHVL